MQEIRTRRACVACGSTGAKPLYRGLVACSTCGMVYFPDRLAPGEAEELYGEDYFRGAEYFDYLADRGAHEANFRRRIRELARWLPAGRRVFEIGCSYGLFLNLARDRWQIRGCDIAEGPCRYAAEALGLDVRAGDFVDVPIGRGEVDAFCLWDTVEHIDALDAYLARIADLLAPGGLVALTTGDVGSRLARVQGPRWRQIHPPTHLWYFSRESMRRTLDRFGFEVVRARSVGVSRSVGQIVYGLTSLGRERPSPLHRFCMGAGLGRLNVRLNTFDLMMVVARRRADRPVAGARAA